MIKTTFIAITLILTVLLLSIFPKQMLSPGDLLKGHRHMDNDCLKCHVLLTGSMGEKCVSCHKLSSIGKFLVSGAAVNADSRPGKAHFHQLFSNESCSSCHSEHTGRKVDAAPKFSHTLLPVKNIGNCLSCHQKPSDAPHQRYGQNCGQCHNTTGNWRAAKVAHDYFRFDKNHTPDCLKCHPSNNNYKEFTCYGCHDHTPEKVRQAHQQKGILSYKNCTVCHPSGDGKDAERILMLVKNQHVTESGSQGDGYRQLASYKNIAPAVIRDNSISNCLSCHQRPFDTLHQNNQSCNQCHSTNSWRTARIDHAQFFRFDRNHNSDCKTCHQSGNYKEYTCYGCHEHSPSKIQRKHQKEGLFSYQNCSACHPSGNEDDARRTARSIRDQHGMESSFSGGAYNPSEGYGQAGYNYIEARDNQYGGYDKRQKHQKDDEEEDDD
ncbi:MAG: hypothetical protein HZB61_05940 [Nitrospirae bacterium]|nr:hypothetical protein [Nitrospirota bacterium]